MLHPVGNQPPAIYWRRRVFLLLLPAFLILLLLWAMFSGGGTGKNTAAPVLSSSSGAAATPTGTVSAPTSISASKSLPSPPSTTSATSAASSSSKAAASTGSAPDKCTKGDLRIEAVTSGSSFAARSGPTFYLQVTDTGKHSCRHDLADKQIELLVRSGDARIWGSHDCKVEPGKDLVTLKPGSPVRRGIVWSGRTSAPGCGGTRLYPQPGTYQLYARLSGRQSDPAAFTITA